MSGDGTELTDVLMSASGSIEQTRIIAELGALSTKPRELKLGTTYAVPDGEGGVRFEATEDEPLNPRAIVQSRTVTDAGSFVDYVVRHGTSNTEVWADPTRSTVVAVIDGNDSAEELADGRRGREKHKVTLVLEHTASWKAWMELDRKLVEQADFAEHIEENAVDVLIPDSATLLEIAQTFQATRGVEFGQSTRLSNGEVQIKYSETLNGKAGRNGDLVIPEELTLGLIPYVGGSGHKVLAKLRWRLKEAVLSIGYSLVRPDVILEEAFKDAVNEIRSGLEATPFDVPIFIGKP